MSWTWLVASVRRSPLSLSGCRWRAMRSRSIRQRVAAPMLAALSAFGLAFTPSQGGEAAVAAAETSVPTVPRQSKGAAASTALIFLRILRAPPNRTHHGCRYPGSGTHDLFSTGPWGVVQGQDIRFWS